jgi:hypothetical protein
MRFTLPILYISSYSAGVDGIAFYIMCDVTPSKRAHPHFISQLSCGMIIRKGSELNRTAPSTLQLNTLDCNFTLLNQIYKLCYHLVEGYLK